MIAASFANHFLARETWARERLAAHAGRAFAVAVGPMSTTLAIDASGMLKEPADGQAPDVTLRVSPLDMPSLLADPARWDAHVATDGDNELAATLADLARTLPWFVERAFASVLGPVVGQRVADAGRALLEYPSYAASRLADGVASYASDEARAVTRGTELAVFGADVAALAARADTLAERIDALAERLAPHS